MMKVQITTALFLCSNLYAGKTMHERKVTALLRLQLQSYKFISPFLNSPCGAAAKLLQ
jgi:hypothetical protein